MIIGLPFRTTCANSGQLFTFHSRAESIPPHAMCTLRSARRIAPAHYQDSMHRSHRCLGTRRAAQQHETAH
jgi:hypothetical protein